MVPAAGGRVWCSAGLSVWSCGGVSWLVCLAVSVLFRWFRWRCVRPAVGSRRGAVPLSVSRSAVRGARCPASWRWPGSVLSPPRRALRGPGVGGFPPAPAFARCVRRPPQPPPASASGQRRPDQPTPPRSQERKRPTWHDDGAGRNEREGTGHDTPHTPARKTRRDPERRAPPRARNRLAPGQRRATQQQRCGRAVGRGASAGRLVMDACAKRRTGSPVPWRVLTSHRSIPR